MNDQWSDRLSEYLDGELSELEVQGLQDHLALCAVCRERLAELRIVVARLTGDRVTEADQPTRREWLVIRRALRPARPRWLVPALAASLAALLLVGVLLRSGPPDRSAGDPAALTLPAEYRQATRDLEALLRDHEAGLRPETVEALRESLALIDSAIAQAARALAADPGNDYVTRSVRRLHEARLITLRHAMTVARQRG